MEKIDRSRRRGVGAASALVSVVLLLAACGPRLEGPAPVVSGDQAPPPSQIVVQRGQTLSGIAHAYHVPMPVLASANHLTPPYRILVGQALIIPGGEPVASGPAMAMAEPMPAPSSAPPPVTTPPSVAARPLVAAPPPISDETRAAAPPPAAAAAPIPLDRPPPASPTRRPEATAPPTSLTPPSGAASPATAATASPSDERAPPAATAAKPAPAAPGPTASAAPSPPPRNGGTFLWPVRGHVLEGYGAGPDGTHNDGINIGAPRGAAVQATDGGVVAYAGNELRGYGDLVLIKHPNGWISAYAHCDLILVKTGQKVVRGQVIARVGSTGNVSEPQLHFELRRGKKPVDPSEYLTPLPTAANREAHPG